MMNSAQASVLEASSLTVDTYIAFASSLPVNPNQSPGNDAAVDMFCALINDRARKAGISASEAFQACVQDVADRLGITPTCIPEEAPFGVRRSVRKAGLNCGQQAQGWK